MASRTAPSSLQLVYRPDERPRSRRDTVLYSLQWIFIMFYPVVWGYALVGTGLGFSGPELGNFMARVALMVGLTTIVQVLLGHRFAMVSGPNIVPSLAVVAAAAVGGREYALLSFNAYIIAGAVVAVLGAAGLFSRLSRVWTPLVQGAMVMTIGLTTSGTALGMLASESAGWPFWAGILLALLCGWLSLRGRTLLATVPVMVTIVLGYVIFMTSGHFDWTMVRAMPAFNWPKLFPYGTQVPPLDLIITMIIVNLFSALNLYGNVNAYADIVGAEVTPQAQRCYFTVFGLVEGSLAGALGVPAYVAYGENLGFVMLTRVASRTFILIGALCLVVMSLFGPVSGLMAAMPEPVAGAVLLGVACTLIGMGAKTWVRSGSFGEREIFIGGFAVFFALGTSLLPPEFFDALPRLVGTLFKNTVILVIGVVMLLEQVLFRPKTGTGAAAQPPSIVTK